MYFLFFFIDFFLSFLLLLSFSFPFFFVFFFCFPPQSCNRISHLFVTARQSTRVQPSGMALCGMAVWQAAVRGAPILASMLPIASLDHVDERRRNPFVCRSWCRLVRLYIEGDGKDDCWARTSIALSEGRGVFLSSRATCPAACFCRHRSHSRRDMYMKARAGSAAEKQEKHTLGTMRRGCQGVW